MLIEIGIADSVGAGYEFAPKEKLELMKLDQDSNILVFRDHNLPGHLKAGSYTDDTQMSIAIAEHILSDEPWTQPILAKRFYETYTRDPRNGYARGFQRLLEEVKSGEELWDKINPNSTRCGAAMRCIPLGLIPEVEVVKVCAEIQAKVTHDTPEGIISSKIVALSAHYIHNRLFKEISLRNFLSKQIGEDIIQAWDLFGWLPGTWVTVEAKDVVRAALSAWSRHSSMTDILVECIKNGGDTDSVAAIAIGLASLDTMGVKNDLPKHLYEGIENGKYGRDYLEMLDDQLEAYFSVKDPQIVVTNL